MPTSLRRPAVLGCLVLLAVNLYDAVTIVADQPPAYFVDESKLPFDALPGTSTTRLWGVRGGAGYRIEVPATWNGDLVLYAHGFAVPVSS